MKVVVRLFAAARQAAGRESLELELPEQATVAQLRRALAERLPQASGIIEQAMVAIDGRCAGDEDVIGDGADVACIPPVSGG